MAIRNTDPQTVEKNKNNRIPKEPFFQFRCHAPPLSPFYIVEQILMVQKIRLKK
jgi:hypothetical protein